MKILNIIAQKVNNTGSGIYLTEIVNCYKNLGYEQEIVCAAYREDIEKDKKENDSKVRYNYVIFNNEMLPMKIAGMSDVMPYESMKYSEFVNDKNKLTLWKKAFTEKIKEVILKFKPDIIISHHLYLLTAIVVNICKNGFKNEKIILKGICHNTDLRQYQKTNLERYFIKSNIKMLNKTFYPSEFHREMAVKLFDLDESNTEVIGIGFNDKIFKRDGAFGEGKENKKEKINKESKLLYVGKISIKKGVLSLIKAINKLDDENITLDIIGGTGDKKEYDEIVEESKKSKSKINIMKAKTQLELAKEYSSHEVFILPSFSEGIPIVPLEAMACGCKVVISDLPGVKKLYEENVVAANIKYVTLPKLSNVDDANDEELEKYEDRLANAIRESINDKKTLVPDLSKISWENIAKNILA